MNKKTETNATTSMETLPTKGCSECIGMLYCDDGKQGYMFVSEGFDRRHMD